MKALSFIPTVPAAKVRNWKQTPMHHCAFIGNPPANKFASKARSAPSAMKRRTNISPRAQKNAKSAPGLRNNPKLSTMKTTWKVQSQNSSKNSQIWIKSHGPPIGKATGLIQPQLNSGLRTNTASTRASFIVKIKMVTGPPTGCAHDAQIMCHPRLVRKYRCPYKTGMTFFRE